jgi:hypothetical protein
MRRVSAAIAGTALLALIGSGGAAAAPPVGKCPARFAPYPESFFAPGGIDIDLNKNDIVCAFRLPPQFGGGVGEVYQVIDDVAQVP